MTGTMSIQQILLENILFQVKSIERVIKDRNRKKEEKKRRKKLEKEDPIPF